jgi:hypothetical protein
MLTIFYFAIVCSSELFCIVIVLGWKLHPQHGYIFWWSCHWFGELLANTGPFIVAAGGISNIFLHRLAENIQDAYGEAASIAEQVY